jgi:hypothetical protein
MKPRQTLWIGVGIAIACVSGCASTNTPLTARQDSSAVARQQEEKAPTQIRKDTTSPAATRKPAQPKGATCYYQYDTCAAMATIRYYDRTRQDLDKAWQRTEKVQKILDSIRRRK